MKTWLLPAVLAGLCLGGCGGHPAYTHPQNTAGQQEADLADCDWEASKATGNVQRNDDRSERIQELVDKCMRAKGYKRN